MLLDTTWVEILKVKMPVRDFKGTFTILCLCCEGRVSLKLIYSLISVKELMGSFLQEAFMSKGFGKQGPSQRRVTVKGDI